MAYIEVRGMKVGEFIIKQQPGGGVYRYDRTDGFGVLWDLLETLNGSYGVGDVRVLYVVECGPCVRNGIGMKGTEHFEGVMVTKPVCGIKPVTFAADLVDDKLTVYALGHQRTGEVD